MHESEDEEYAYDKVWAMDEVDRYDAWQVEIQDKNKSQDLILWEHSTRTKILHSQIVRCIFETT